jgi:hypothetical protein
MSDTANSAQHTYVAIEDPAAPGTFVDVSEKAHNVRMPLTKGDLDSSTFGQGDNTSKSGMRDGTFTLDTRDDPALRALCFRIFMSDNPVRCRYGPDGPDAGNQRFTAAHNMTGWDMGGAVNTINGSSVAFHRTGQTTLDLFT